MTQVTKAIDEEWTVAVDLGTYTDLIETDYKYRMLRDTLIKSLKYYKWNNCKMEIEADKVAPILNAIEPVVLILPPSLGPTGMNKELGLAV